MTQKLALVTGVSGDIGFEIARLLCASGYRVSGLSRSRNRRVSQLFEVGMVRHIQVDLASELEIQAAKFDNFDILVNCAGILLTKTLTHESPMDGYIRTIAVNMTAPMLLIQRVIPHMIDTRWGRIVNIGSIYSLRGTSLNCAYNMSKHGLSALTKTVAKEYASLGITSNEICPAAVESSLMRRIAKEKESSDGLSVGDYLSSVAALLPSQRLPRPVEIAGLVGFLVSDAAVSVNGASIPIDGGFLA